MKHNLLESFKKKDYDKIIEKLSVRYDENWRCIDLVEKAALEIYITNKHCQSLEDKTYLVYFYDRDYLLGYSTMALRCITKGCILYMNEIQKHRTCLAPLKLRIRNTTISVFYSQVTAKTLYGLCKEIIETPGSVRMAPR